jgi:hypothetical protein
MLRGRTAVGQDDIRRELHQLGCVLAKRFDIAAAVANFEAYVSAFEPAQFTQRLHQDPDAGVRNRASRAGQHGNAPHGGLAWLRGLKLLCVRQLWPRGSRTAENTEKIPPPHAHPQDQDALL